MATIKESFGSGGANVPPGGAGGSPTLAGALRDMIDDVTNTRTALTGLLTKLDSDTGVADTDYSSSLAPSALLSIKG